MERDDAGRSVAVPDQVHRAGVAVAQPDQHGLCAGRTSDLVGITNYTSYPPEAAREKPSVGAVVNPSLERIVALHPDMVLALPAFNGAETIAGLERVGIPVFLFSTGSVANIYRTIASVGRVLGSEREATRADCRACARGRAKCELSRRESPKPTVLLVLSIDPLITAGRSAFITEMIAAAGAKFGDRRSPAGLAADER